MGVLLHSFFNFSFEFSLLMFLIGIFILLLYFVLKNTLDVSKQRNEFAPIFFISIALISLSFGILRFNIEKAISNPNTFDTHLNEDLKIKALVVKEVEKDLDNAKVVALVKKINGKSVEKSAKISVITKPFISLEYGDTILIEGEIQKPSNFKSENGREFDYVSYLAKDEIFYQSFYPDIEKISSGGGNFIKAELLSFKNKFLQKLKSLIPSPESDLLGGLLLGSKGPLGDKLQSDFRKTGLIHIVVLSGYNVTVVAQAITKGASFMFSPALAALFSVFSIICFAILTGAGATVVRASIMALLVILARATKRTYAITRALFLAGFLMIIYDPEILVFDPSFQLSFVAAFGLIMLSPYFEKLFNFLPNTLGFREVAGATISTQIFILPLILYMMGELSIVSVPVNLFVLVTIPITMLLGFLTGIFSFVSSLVALPFAYGAYLLLMYQLKIVEFFASFSFSAIKIDFFPFWFVIFLYLGYAFLIYYFIYNKRG